MSDTRLSAESSRGSVGPGQTQSSSSLILLESWEFAHASLPILESRTRLAAVFRLIIDRKNATSFSRSISPCPSDSDNPGDSISPSVGDSISPSVGDSISPSVGSSFG